MRFLPFAFCLLPFALLCGPGPGEPAKSAATPPAAGTPAAAPAPASTIEKTAAETTQRTDLNLMGQTDTKSGESRRNENVQFNPIDNNALKELNVRMGTTATIVPDFRSDRNYFSSELGNAPPTPIYVSGAKLNGIHGSIYENHNNSIFSARSFFQVGGVKPARTNDYGFTFTAPVWRNAFVSAEAGQQKVRGSVNGNVLVPLPSERSVLATDPALAREVARFMAAYPAQAPNRTDIDPRALNTNAPQRINTDSAGLKLDQFLGRKDRLTFQYRYTNQAVEAFQLIAGQNPNTDTTAHIGRITWNRAWNAATITNFSAAFDQTHSLLVPEKNAVGPQVNFGSVIDPLGPSSNLPINRTQNVYRYAGMLQRAAGRHTWSAGAGLGRRQINGSEASSHRGVIYFQSDSANDAMTYFRLGQPARYSTAIGDPHRGFRQWDMEFFAGDTWRAGRNLTLTYGIRYQPVTTPVEVQHLNTLPYACSCTNFAPRFGFAYRLPDSWGVLRGAYGMHFGEIFPVTFQQIRFTPPLVNKIEVHNPGLLNPLASLSPEDRAGGRATLFQFDLGLSTPYSHQYNFSWEPSIGKWRVQLGYVGSRSHKLLMMWYTNRAHDVSGIPKTNATVNERRADTRYFDVRRVLNGSRAYFDAARASLYVPRWRGADFEISYWLSKAIDLGANYTNPATSADSGQIRSQSEYNVVQDLKSVSVFDQRHSFLLRGSFEAPRRFGKWVVSGVVLLKTGQPFDVLTGSDSLNFGNVDGSQGDRPNLLDPSILGRTIGDPDTSRQMLRRSAFAFLRPTDERGNLGHNVFRRGGIHNVNASLARTWKIALEKSLTLRAESINFFNTPQFAEPTKELTSPSFGQITNTLNDGRTFRFMLRFQW